MAYRGQAGPEAAPESPARPACPGAAARLLRTGRAVPARLARTGRRVAAGLASRAVRAAAGLRATLDYRRGELAVMGLLALTLVAGAMVDRWRRGTPELLERLETLAGSPRPRPPGTGQPRGRPRPRAESSRRQPSRESPALAPEEPASSPGLRPPPGDDAAGPPPVLDLDRAPAEVLASLPGIGPRLAGHLVTWRQALGGRFQRLEDLLAVPGLGRRRAVMLWRLARPTGAGAPEAAEGPRGGPPSPAAPLLAGEPLCAPPARSLPALLPGDASESSELSGGTEPHPAPPAAPEAP